MELSTIIDTSSSVEQQFQKRFGKLSREQQFNQLLDLLHATSEADERIAEVAWEAWRYVKTHRLWETRYPTLEAFQDAIDYEKTLKAILARHKMLSDRKQRDARGILENWGRLPHEVLPPELKPSTFSKHVLSQLNRLSKVCLLDHAITMLKKQVERRLSLPAVGTIAAGYSRASQVLAGDIIVVWEQVNKSLEANAWSQGSQTGGTFSEGQTCLILLVVAYTDLFHE